MTTKNKPKLARYAPFSEVSLQVEMLGISLAHLVRPLDEQYITELVETDESEWEPIEVRLWPAEWSKPSPSIQYHVVSGNHRTSAAQRKGLHVVRGRIIEASDDLSYMLAAIRTNARHGRNFTTDDRKVLAAKLKSLGQSSSQVAKLFGVSKSTVDNWLSGRDTNAARHSQKEKQAEGMRLLADAEADRVDDEWASLPDVSVDERKLVETRREIIDFLRTPAVLDKAHVVKLIRSLALEDRESLFADMQVAARWLQNVSALLEVKR